MRIDLDLLYKQLTLPRHMRRNDFNVLAPLQVHRWDAVPYDPTLPMNSSGNSETGTLVSNYPLTGGTHSRESTEGVAFDIFLSRISGVQVEFRPPPPNVMVNVLNTVVSCDRPPARHRQRSCVQGAGRSTRFRNQEPAHSGVRLRPRRGHHRKRSGLPGREEIRPGQRCAASRDHAPASLL